jgi:2-oxoglutarate/2-oxoacid ferredoxin oxidoreductase subunit alpha
VMLNIMRGGPGLGGILPAQSDYLQATKGGGHGDYRVLVLAPSTVQEAVDLTMLGFHLADKYRNPVMILGDGMIGQMMEPVEFPEKYEEPPLPPSSEWATTGAKGRAPRIIKSLHLDPYVLEDNSIVLDKKYQQMKKEEPRFELYKVGAKNRILIVSYGTMARICQTVIDELETEGISVGLFRPVTVYPYPEEALKKEANKANIETILTVEMSMGQMLEDVERIVCGARPIKFFGRTGGIVPTPDEVKDKIKHMIKQDIVEKPRRKKG